jgi:hypothetical protein
MFRYIETHGNPEGVTEGMVGGGRAGGRECSVGERLGEERERDAEEGRWERWLDGRCGHHGSERRSGKRGNSEVEVGALRPSDGRSLLSIIPYRLQPASSGVSGGGAALHTSAAPAACSVASSSCLLPHQLRRLRAFFQLPLHARKLATSM